MNPAALIEYAISNGGGEGEMRTEMRLSTTAVLRVLSLRPTAMMWINREREKLGMKPLRKPRMDAAQSIDTTPTPNFF
jgi:hypothetical protein